MLVRGGRLIPRVDADAAEALQAAFEEEGIVLRFGVQVERVEPGVKVTLAGGETLEAERLLAAVGRKPNVDDLGLEQLGVEISERGIEVDEQLRAAENVWALGDCNGIAQLTHVGKYQARVAAARRRRPRREGRLPRDSVRRLHRPAGGDRRNDRGRGAHLRPLGGAVHVASIDVREAEAARLRQGRRRPEAARARRGRRRRPRGRRVAASS